MGRKKILIIEGVRVVGVATILKVFNPILKKEDIIFPDNATAILLAIKQDFIQHLKFFSPYLITENSKLSNFIPKNFVNLEERAEKIYSTICSIVFVGNLFLNSSIIRDNLSPFFDL